MSSRRIEIAIKMKIKIAMSQNAQNAHRKFYGIINSFSWREFCGILIKIRRKNNNVHFWLGILPFS